MKKKSLTVIRNAKIVGKNSKSYNAKHPVSLVSLRPIHDACKATNKDACKATNKDAFKATNKDAFKLRAKIRSLANCSRPTIAHGIAHYIGG